MNYYRICLSGVIVDAAENPVWVKQFKNRIVRCDIGEAMGIVSSDGETIYQISGQKPITNGGFTTAIVEDITEEEYKELQTLLELGAEVDKDTLAVEWETEPDNKALSEEFPEQTAEYRTSLTEMMRNLPEILLDYEFRLMMLEELGQG